MSFASRSSKLSGSLIDCRRLLRESLLELLENGYQKLSESNQTLGPLAVDVVVPS